MLCQIPCVRAPSWFAACIPHICAPDTAQLHSYEMPGPAQALWVGATMSDRIPKQQAPARQGPWQKGVTEVMASSAIMMRRAVSVIGVAAAPRPPALPEVLPAAAKAPGAGSASGLAPPSSSSSPAG